MPIVSIDAPAGLPLHRKKRLMLQINAALTAAYAIADNIVLLREHRRENVAIAGTPRAENPAKPRAATRVPAHRISS
jgi:hypothetical protein